MPRYPSGAVVGSALLLAALASAGCSRPKPPQNAPALATPAGQAASPLLTLDLTYDRPARVGSVVHATAHGLPAGATVDLQWATVAGGWVVEDGYHFRGKKYTDVRRSLGRFEVARDGRLDTQFTIPEDYGGVHDVLATIDGRAVAQNGVNVTQSFEMSPAEGPIGTPVELKVRGLGWRTMESTWVVNWDNHALGWVSAAGTRGTATARFRATGPAGDHIVKLYTGWQGQAYLNHEQSPVASLPRPQFTFHTSAAPSVGREPHAEPYQPQPLPGAEPASTTLALVPSQGPVGTSASLKGDGFTPRRTLRIEWETFVGSRVTESGFAAEQRAAGTVLADDRGHVESTFTVPDDLGGVHALSLRDGDRLVGRAFFVTETSIVSMAPREGPPGTPVSIHLKGVGWTEYDNIYVATYDNAYMGYACGFNSQGDVVINFTASGVPGDHVIDLYPGIYQGPPNETQQLYRQPQLTYADDHPGNKLPALRFMFRITPQERQERR